jgi:two-component system sensor histidine kinase VicK
VHTIDIIFSSFNIFYIQEKLGVIQSLKNKAKHGVNIRILTHKSGYVGKTVQALKKEIVDGSFDAHYFSWNSDIRTKTLIVDREQSLAMEILQVEEGEGIGERETEREYNYNKISKQEAKQLLSFNNNEIIGLSTYSNSKSTVLSYAAVFETLWKETELHEQLRQSKKRLETTNEELESTNRQLALANEELKVNDQIQKDFINIAAHELRTPTQCIVGYSEMLYMEPEESKKYLAPILRSAKRLERLTGDILDLTRIDSRSLRLNKEQLSLDEVILHAIQDTRSNQIGHYKKGRVSVIYDSRARKEGEFVIEADKVRLTQVISHILGNAIRFTNEGTITINIDRKAITSSSNSSSHQKGVIISIKDTGTGIDSQIFSRLFSKFATKSEKGTGLGLFISKSIVEAHGGKIWAENNADGIGATFAFSLPLGS